MGRLWGVGAEASFGQVDSISRDRNYSIPTMSPGDTVYLRSGSMITGGRASAGYRVSDVLAVGLSGYVFNNSMNLGGRDSEDDPRSNTLSASATVGAYARLLDERLTLDSLVTVPFLQEVYLDQEIQDYVAYKTAPFPIV